MKKFIYLLIVISFALCFTAVSDDEPAQLPPAERAKKDAEFRQQFETASVQDWKNMLVDIACNKANHFDAMKLYSGARRFYCAKNVFGCLETFSDSDIAAIKEANAGTNNLEAAWTFLAFCCIEGCRGYHYDPHALGCGWQLECENLNYSSKFNELINIPAVSDRFWWYIGRCYADKIWEEWYSCWKAENARREPRVEVKKRLAIELYNYIFYIFPYLVEALDAGDVTLLGALKVLDDGCCFSDFSSHTLLNDPENIKAFWQEQKQAYALDTNPRDGLEAAVKNARVADKIFESWQSDFEVSLLTEWAKTIEAYYSRPYAYREKLFWYHFLDDEKDYTEKELAEFLCCSDLKAQKAKSE